MPSIKILENIPLAPLTTLQIGGPARFFTVARSEEDVSGAFSWAHERKLENFVLGGGSNVLIADKGFNGLVTHVRLEGTSIGSHQADGMSVTAAAGEDWEAFVEYCVANALAGVECLSGIPGSVGGTPVQNVGAYGQEVSETIVSVRCFDRENHDFVDLSNKQCGFEYRKSIFNTSLRDRYVVLAVTYRLIPNGEPKIAYKDIQDHFDGREPTLVEVREAVLKIRRAKSMVIDPADPNSLSAGSFFKNPIVPATILSKIAEKLMIQNVPSFRVNERDVKIPAAWLIERTGFSKGYALGRAGISSNHTLAIINRGGAAAAEIVALKDRIQKDVGEKFDIFLEPEPIFVGF